MQGYYKTLSEQNLKPCSFLSVFFSLYFFFVQGLEAVPDMLVQLFSMLIRYLIYCPHAISTSPSLPTVFELAKAGVVLRNKGPLQQVCRL